jgi:hypothetical protein
MINMFKKRYSNTLGRRSIDSSINEIRFRLYDFSFEEKNKEIEDLTQLLENLNTEAEK